MKKIILVCIGVVMLFSFASCNGGMPTGVSYENVGHGLIKVTAGSGCIPIVAWKADQMIGRNADSTTKTGAKWCSMYLGNEMDAHSLPKHVVYYLPISGLFGKNNMRNNSIRQRLADMEPFEHKYGDISEIVLGFAEGNKGLFDGDVTDEWGNKELVDFKLNSDCTKFELSETGKNKGLKVGQSFSIKTADYTEMNTKITSAKAADPTVASGKVSYTVEVKKDGADTLTYYAAVVPSSAENQYPYMDKAAYKLDGSGKFEAETSCSDKKDFQEKYAVYIFGCDDSNKKKAATNVRWVVPKMAVPESMKGKWTYSPTDKITITLECTVDGIYISGTDSDPTESSDMNMAKFDLLAQVVYPVAIEEGDPSTFKVKVGRFVEEHGNGGSNPIQTGTYEFNVTSDSSLEVVIDNGAPMAFAKSTT